jgi:hypothetical protein
LGRHRRTDHRRDNVYVRATRVPLIASEITAAGLEAAG